MAGVVAAGHPESAAAGAAALREGGNAVDAAVGAVLASFAVESPLTGLGAGGYMVVHDRGETTLLDFFVAAPGLDGTPRTAELAPVTVVFDETTSQTFYVGPVSCAVPGTPAGLVEALRRFGSMPLAELAAPAIRLAREGSPVNHQQAYILEILEPIHARLPGTRELYAPEGRTLREGETFRFEELAVALERFAAEGVVPFYRGEVAAALSDFVIEGGGTLGRGDLAAYAAIEREPVHAAFRGAEVLTNPRPSAGGTLIAHSLETLERLGPTSDPEHLVAAMDAANEHRASLLGSTTHISVIDADGMCAAVTCSNGSGLRRPRPGDRRDPQQHARRGGPEPGRLPPDRAGPAGAVDDGADRGPPRRRGRPRGRQRRLQPDPLGDPADGGAGGRAGDGPAGGDRRPAPALRGRARCRPSRGSTRRRWRGSRPAASPSSASPSATSTSAASRPSPATRRPEP